MNPSAAAVSAVESRMKMLSFDDLSALVREKGLYPKNGRAITMSGKALLDLSQITTLSAVENRINELVYAVKNAGNAKEAGPTLAQTSELAGKSVDSHELYYLTSMFIHHRDVMRILAKNPAIDERTQMIIANDQDCKNDRETQLSLAHNPALGAVVLAKLFSESTDQFVHQAIALNVVTRAKSLPQDSDYADLCKQLAGTYDTVIRQTAIPGIRDPEVLREIANNNSVILAPRELEAVASNPFTPNDVLERLSTRSFPTLQNILSITVAEKARSTLSNKLYQSEISENISHP